MTLVIIGVSFYLAIASTSTIKVYKLSRERVCSSQALMGHPKNTRI
jgi:hypothetical protein